MIENKRDYSKIRQLDNEYEERTIINEKYIVGSHIYCLYCKRNCHKYWYCARGFLNRCYIFPIFWNDCEKCWNSKSEHVLHNSYKFVTETERIKVNNNYEIENEK